jgi:hypothetical protein
MFYDVYVRIFSKYNFISSNFMTLFFETKGSSACKILVKTPQKLAFKRYFLIYENLYKLEVKYLNFENCISNSSNLKNVCNLARNLF